METKQNAVMSSLSSLREELHRSSNTAIELHQAFDRLLAGYQNGQFSDREAALGAAEIRRALAEKPQPSGLMPRQGDTQRETVLCRNSQAVAERFLSEDRGAWDSRHLEIVQSAIAQLAKSHSPETADLASSLQTRMSDSVWMNGFELAENVSQAEEEARTLQSDILDMMRQSDAHSSVGTRDLLDTERVLAEDNKREDIVRTSVERARRQTALDQIKTDDADLHVSSEYINNLTANMRQSQKQIDAQASESIKAVSQRLIDAEFSKMRQLFKSALASIANQISPEEAEKLSRSVDNTILSSDNSAEALLQQINDKTAIFAPYSGTNDSIKRMTKEAQRIQLRVSMLRNLLNDAQYENVAADEGKSAQILDARMLFEQKRMQFEQNPRYAQATAEMQKALDFSVGMQNSSASSKFSDDIQRVMQIAQSAASGDVGLYAPAAGSERVNNAAAAVKFAEQKAPVVSHVPTLYSNRASHTNGLINAARPLAFMPSMRADMGFSLPRYQMTSDAQPLFKRIRFSKDNYEANQMLPSLYNVAGVKVKKNAADKPLRKSNGTLNIDSANLEILKIIESQFDDTGLGRKHSQVSGYSNADADTDTFARDPKSRLTGIINNWLETRHDAHRGSGNMEQRIASKEASKESIETNLRSEGRLLPKAVQDKLAPFLGFDLSNIRIYAGPVAAAAAEAMGAHAFTLGKSIFLGKSELNFNTPEGLGLLAHEMLHTSHFDKGGTVDAKEQAAESVEERVKNAFGSGEKMLALESNGKAGADKSHSAPKSINASPNPSGRKKFNLDPDAVYDDVCERVLQLMVDSMRQEKERFGMD